MPDGVSQTEELFLLSACGCFSATVNATAEGFFQPLVGGLVQCHIAMGEFSEECFPCLAPTTGLVVLLPDVKLYVLFTAKKRRKNEQIEAHSVHTTCPLFVWGAEFLS